ncbi:hypothetical protein H4R18_002203 [Coemansia javaensis]|uniref:Ubiquitin-conjugating enzyme E2C-binding protein n=1 Tax=Coemansia javaensis TaxID=2761396 RepID=A0A9W8HAD6_9FUNG|nr:hypothetical protein H4R18_002203 [Coemansia javaensis]
MPAAYYIEVLDNLEVVDIYAAAGGEIHLAGSSAVSIGGGAQIALPVSVYPHKAVRAVLPPADGGSAAEWVRLRVPIDHRSRQLRSRKVPQSIASIGRPATAASLGALRDIQCRACGAGLFSSAMKGEGAACNVRDLPSAHWSELVDCWMCHPEEDTLNVNPELMFAFEPQRKALSRPGSPAPDGPPEAGVHVWVGSTSALVPAQCMQGLRARLAALDDKERFYNAFAPLHCESCDAVVGEAGHVGRRHTYKLYLHRIGLLSAERTVAVSLSQAVCSELLSHAGAHAVYKYVVEGRVSCKPAVLVHLVGWNADIMAAPAGGRPVADSEGPAFVRCAKVLFARPGDRGFDALAAEWLDSEAAEVVPLFDEDCARLVELLAANSLRIPPQLRAMSGLTRSFLGQ